MTFAKKIRLLDFRRHSAKRSTATDRRLRLTFLSPRHAG